MKQKIYILTITIGLLSCNNLPKQVEHITSAKSDSTLNNNSVIISNDSLQGERQQDTSKIVYLEMDSNVVTIDSVIWFYEADFTDLQSELKEISDSKFKEYKKTYKTTCELDKSGFVKGKGLILDHYCKDICETYLIDKKERTKLILPSDYDQGIIGIIISPSCNQFFVYSSHDGPGYTNYYGHRAEVFGFTIAQGQGIQTIKSTFKFYTNDWSIEEVNWISDNEIAFKTYEEARSNANEDNLNYKYFKTRVIN